MSSTTAYPTPSEAFANRAADPATERALHAWDVAKAPTLVLAVAAPAPGAKTWGFSLPVKANRQTMLFVDVVLDCGADAGRPVATGYKTSFVVEWSGWNNLHFTASSLARIGEPAGLHAVQRLRLSAGTATFAGTVLELGAIAWLDDAPLVKVTPYEDMVVNFLSPRMWDRADWRYTGGTGLPDGEQAMEVGWMYTNVRYLQKPGRRHRTAYTRRMNVDLTPYQAVTLFTATDVRAAFSVVLEIDGQTVRAIDRRRGLGGGDEMRAAISGRRLTALTLELEQAEAEIREPNDVQVATSIRWILLERKGTDPALVGEAPGIAPVPPPERVGVLEQEILPVGVMIGREEFLQLRAGAQRPGRLQKMAREIVAEAEAHLAYQPEKFAGRYLPVDLGNQGCERRVSPADQMFDVNSCMVYGGLAYALTGDVRYGQVARRGLFTALRCTTWQAGFASRIPSGLPGYRAPFIETAAAECVAMAYDFVYPLLSPAERREVEDALYEKALPWIDMYLRLNGEGYLLKSNQGAVYTAGLVCAALVARRSHPDVDAILERGIAWFPRMLNNYYKVTGASDEGPGYWEYTTQHVVEAVIAICRYKGWRVQDYAPPHLDRTIDYLMHLRSLARERLSFLPLSDNIEGVGYNFMNSSFLFFAKYYRDPNAFWLWHEYYAPRPNPPGSLFFGKRMAGACSLSGLLEFLLYVDGAPHTPQLPPAKHFEVCDRIFLRTGCRHGDILLMFEGGPQTFEHTHSDKGQFIMEAYGERFAADPGTIKYQDPAHLFYKATSYHNLVSLRGADQEYRDAARAVVLERTSYGPECDCIAADLVNSYLAFDRYKRRILFVRPHYFVVVDDVTANETGLEWNYHACVPIKGVDLAAGQVRFTGAKAAMTLAIGSDRPLQATQGVYGSEGVVLTHNLVLTQVEPAKSMKIAAVLLPFPLSAGAGPEPTVVVEQGKEGVEFKVSGAWGTDRVRCDWGSGTVEVTRRNGGGERRVGAG
ncbi:MAG: heparinase II/III family protein [Opitutaceae bacterium]|nr:heparinase II/III family protein [Opitutaceae bacterium]